MNKRGWTFFLLILIGIGIFAIIAAFFPGWDPLTIGIVIGILIVIVNLYWRHRIKKAGNYGRTY